jgi:hypothetical protein
MIIPELLMTSEAEYFGDEKETKPPWYEFVMDWEIPSRWHPIRRLKWRHIHQKINMLERELGIADQPFGEYGPRYYLIWGDPFGGY